MFKDEEDFSDFIDNFDQVFDDNRNEAYNELDPDKSYKYLIIITAIDE